MVASRWQASLPLLLAVLLAQPAGRAEDAAATEAAKRDARALGWLIQRGVRVLAQPAAPVAQPPVDEQRRQAIEQHVKQMERHFQPILNGELELIRLSCDGLAPEARQQILAAGREAVASTARGFAERQLTGRLGQDEFEPRQEILGRLDQALAPLADPAALAGYRQELKQREARRAESARVAIVVAIDRQLQLSAEQRSRIMEELARKWQAEWARDLGSRGDTRVNGLPPAPDYAAEAIEPHLDREQLVAWKEWLKRAGSRHFGRHLSWHVDGSGLQQLDPWWGR